jgi:hypothetical protein
MNETNERRVQAWCGIIVCLVGYLLPIAMVYNSMAHQRIALPVGMFLILTITVTAFTVSLLVIFKPFQK